MRRAVLFFILFLGVSSVFGQSSKTLRTYGITKKTETEVKYSGGLEVARYIEEIEIYNGEGDWVEKFTYDSGGELKLLEKRVYEKDEIIDETTIDLNGSSMKSAKPPSFERALYTYEKGDVVLERFLSKEGDVVEQKEFVYNKLGDLVEAITKASGGEVMERETTEYDNRGLKIREQVFDSDGTLLKEKLFKYE